MTKRHIYFEALLEEGIYPPHNARMNVLGKQIAYAGVISKALGCEPTDLLFNESGFPNFDVNVITGTAFVRTMTYIQALEYVLDALIRGELENAND